MTDVPRIQPETRQRPFEVAFICTGNRFRSPIAEALLRARAEGFPIRARSLGIRDLGPVGVLPEAARETERSGLDLSAHRARPLAGEDLSSSDLVIGFERIHVAAAVVDAHARLDRSFLLLELLALLRDLGPPAAPDGVERAREQVARAHQARAALGIAAEEIADPLGGPDRIYRETAERLEQLSDELAARLFGHEPPARHETPDGLLGRLRRRRDA